VPAEVIPLGSRLRQHREQLGLTQAQAARELDVARTAYRLWEMEAARPAPDRWRAIASWLGISMTAMLLAEELIDEQEALDARRAATGSGMSEIQWDTASDESAGDYFSQERSMIAARTRQGDISIRQAASLGRVLSRIQNATSSHEPSAWHPANFHKQFPSDPLAPALARAALAATAVGIPVHTFENAALLISELVTNSIKHTDTDWVEVEVTLGLDLLRIEVSDQGTQAIRPRTPGKDGGWGLTLVAELTTRWGVERQTTGKTIWIEFDLTPVEAKP
jgi:transcriptional regulator with XRE-family HTH domain/anti-sigma regulatory factor (Ser/Thr protein kinase)